MVSVERIKQFTNLPSEAPWKIVDTSPPQNWPSHGTIELNNLQVYIVITKTKYIYVGLIGFYRLSYRQHLVYPTVKQKFGDPL